MRLMFYGLQNSGATLVTLFAGQRRASLVIPDLWTMYCAPRVPDGQDICVKVTVTTAFPLESHLAQYQPDHAFLVVRRPVDNALSLRRKPYARHDGTPEDKFELLDSHFANPGAFTDVIVFEDFVADPSRLGKRLDALGWELPAEAANFPRTPLEMEQDNWHHAPQLYDLVQWGTGEARVEPLTTIYLGVSADSEATRFAQRHAPRLHEHYEERPVRARRGREAPQVSTRVTSQDESSFQGHTRFVSHCLGLFESLLRGGDIVAALALAEDLHRLAPENAAAWGALSRALEMDNRHEEATMTLVREVETSDPGSPRQGAIRLALASHFLRGGDLEQSRAIASDLLIGNPGLVAARYLLAESSLRRRNFEDARSQALRMLEHEPRNIQARRVIAEGLFAAARIDEACDWLRSALAIAPDFEVAQRRLAHFRSHEGTG